MTRGQEAAIEKADALAAQMVVACGGNKFDPLAVECAHLAARVRAHFGAKTNAPA